jgi:hypothetical protein
LEIAAGADVCEDSPIFAGASGSGVTVNAVTPVIATAASSTVYR